MDAPASLARERLRAARRVVVKVGTNVLTAGTAQLDLAIMANLVDQIARVIRSGREVLLVSSGAVAAGRHQLQRRSTPQRERTSTVTRQMLASVGQSRLMAAYDELFGWHDLIVAQALLTRADLADWPRYLNARTTLISLVEHGVVPIINENDVVAVEELTDLSFGDNDALSTQVANLVEADALVILTDTAGLYTADPRTDTTATLVPYVETVTDQIAGMAGGSGSRGRGGMSTKVRAARLATMGGVAVVIAGGREPDVLARVLEGEKLGTLFAPVQTRLEGRKRWLLSGMGVKGRIVVDQGASHALRDQGRSLLPAGVRSVSGVFDRGDTVDIVDDVGRLIGHGITSYQSADVASLQGAKSDTIQERLGYDYGAEIIHRNNLVLVERTGATLGAAGD